jgi:hypothetical protein
MTSLPSFIFRSLTQVLEVANRGDSFKKIELVLTFGDFMVNSNRKESTLITIGETIMGANCLLTRTI